MNRDDITRMAREAAAGGPEIAVFTVPELERFAVLVAAAERNKLAAWMMAKGYATGHGDTVEDLLHEVAWQTRESELKACCDLLEGMHAVSTDRHNYWLYAANELKRLRGRDPMPLFDDWNKDWK